MQLKDVIHHYIGQKMQYATHHEPQNEAYVLSYENIKEAIEFGDIIILRRIEDLTEEEMIEVAKISDILPARWLETKKFEVRLVDHPNEGIEICCLGYAVRLTKSNEIYFYDYSRPNLCIYMPRTPLVIHYLLSIGIDLFGLIDSGQAIDKKTLNNGI